jgi:hypothetical protein
MARRSIRLSSSAQDTAIRAGEFQLLPSPPALPFIASQPINNFVQYSWIIGFDNGLPLYQEIKPKFNVVRALQNTAFSFEVRVTDPSNVNDRNSLDNISFVWKKDGATVYSLNRLNGGVGVSGLSVSQQNSKPDLSGVYTCEVSNNFGTTTTQPLELEIVDPLQHPKMFKNLILNGDGEGGLDNWIGDGQIVVDTFQMDITTSRKFGSFNLGRFNTADYNEAFQEAVLPQFRFSAAGQQGAFYLWHRERSRLEGTNFTDINTKSIPNTSFPEWVAYNTQPHLVPNEDFYANGGPYDIQNKLPAAFFPGVRWMDLYNQNTGSALIGLRAEIENQTPNYFTRRKIKFEKFGGREITSMNQTIDLNDVADYVDGYVYGVKYMTSQFFAYVGIGITDYKIKCQTTEGEKTFNYFIKDSEEVYDSIVRKSNEYFPDVRVEQRGDSKYTLLPNTDIEIIPQCNDLTNITISYLDSLSKILKEEVIPGPTVEDIWALKEKVYFVLTLYAVYEYLIPNGNNAIRVFGQKFTDTNAMQAFFAAGSGLFGREYYRTQNALPANLTDVTAKHFLNKYRYTPITGSDDDWRKGTVYPGYIWYGEKSRSDAVPPVNNPYWYYKALPDYGGAAMIGVGKDIIIPSQTRSVRIKVDFIHTSQVIKDVDSRLKGWTSQEIYSDIYGNTSNTSARVVEYGNPRCGITKMKFILAPNNIQISDQYVTYNIPPLASTVLGWQKARLQLRDEFNTANQQYFRYILVNPYISVPQPPQVASPFLSLQDLSAYEAQQQNLLNQANVDVPPDAQETPNMPGNNTITETEDRSFVAGELNNSLGITSQQAERYQ